MSKLECGKCGSIYADVVRVLKCPLCGCTSFEDAEFDIDGLSAVSKRFPWWFVREGTMGFFYEGSIRTDRSARLD